MEDHFESLLYDSSASQLEEYFSEPEELVTFRNDSQQDLLPKIIDEGKVSKIKKIRKRKNGKFTLKKARRSKKKLN